MIEDVGDEPDQLLVDDGEDVGPGVCEDAVEHGLARPLRVPLQEVLVDRLLVEAFVQAHQFGHVVDFGEAERYTPIKVV